MDLVTRRKFLLASGVVGGGALASGAGAFTLTDILDTANTDDFGSSSTANGRESKVLVVITLYGGNDGLNTVIPYADKLYHDARPGLGYEEKDVLKLGEDLGLNPGLKGLHGFWQDKRLAVVRGVGYPKPDRSHFRSMDIWQTANPTEPTGTGWLGRWLDARGDDPRLAVSFEPVLPPLLAGARTSGAAVTLNGVKTGFKDTTIAAMGKAAQGEPALQARAAATFANMIQVNAMIKDVKESQAPNGTPEGTGATGTGGGRTALSQQLDLVARCVEAGVSTRVYSVSLGGFDMHAIEKDAHQRLLAQLDNAVTAFVNRMGNTENGKKAVVMIYSEFGRRIRSNASEGTDHGTASDVFVIGSGVNGGFYGDQPSLKNTDQGDLKFTTDFRNVYASLLGGVLVTDPVRVLNGWKTKIEGLIN